MQIVIDIPNAPIKDYQDLHYKIHGMAASEGLFDDKVKSQRALALKVVLDILDGIENGTPLDNIRAEIEARLCDVVSNYTDGYRTAIQGVLDILDKYKVESEDKE